MQDATALRNDAMRRRNGAMRRRIEAELTGNILPFWAARTPDEENGGFYGALTNDLQVLNGAPRSAVLTARILWTFAAAYHLTGAARDLAIAQRAYDTLLAHFRDPQHGGVYWTVDRRGQPLDDRKHAYAQAFTIYGLAEYARATGDPAALAEAQALFRLLEAHTYDPVNGGYIEGCTREWGALADMRLSAVDVNSRKSMNTLLHIMEAYTNLLRAWPDAGLRAQLKGLIQVFFDHVIDPEAHRFRLFFDDRWRWAHLSTTVSYGHDIEGSWLLVEAAEALGDTGGVTPHQEAPPPLLTRARAEAVAMADAVLRAALNPDGSIRYESGGHDERAAQKHWWAHAEAVVGFYNAYQLSGEARFADAAAAVWEYIDARFVDREHGDWFKVLDPAGAPLPDQPKVGPWECPYHHSRMCFEMLARSACTAEPGAGVAVRM